MTPFTVPTYLAEMAFETAAILKFKGNTEPLPQGMALAGSHGANDVSPIEADADLFHFKAHRDNPDQIPISAEIVLEFVGVAMTAVPDLFH
jgi:hypothetical protein